MLLVQDAINNLFLKPQLNSEYALVITFGGNHGVACF